MLEVAEPDSGYLTIIRLVVGDDDLTCWQEEHQPPAPTPCPAPTATGTFDPTPAWVWQGPDDRADYYNALRLPHPLPRPTRRFIAGIPVRYSRVAVLTCRIPPPTAPAND